MNNIDTRPPFFPNSKTAKRDVSRSRQVESLKRNSNQRAQEIEAKTSQHAKVNIPDSIKDFSKIKKLADQAEPVDNTAKIADLKSRIQAGTYQMDYDALADKILQSEM